MAYSDFTLNSVKQAFSLTTNEETDLFAEVAEVSVSEHLQVSLPINGQAAVVSMPGSVGVIVKVGGG